MFENEHRCCGTCRWHEHEEIDDGWVCVNDDSLYVTEWTEYSFCCSCWESRQ